MNFASTKDRIIDFINYKEITTPIFLEKTGIKRGFLDGDKMQSSVSDVFIAKILAAFPDINLEWLITGKGEMTISDNPSLPMPRSLIMEEEFKGGAPFYNDLPVSAGQIGEIVPDDEKPSGYLKIPGIIASHFFPVVGYSMKPEINPGDIIGINSIDRWEKVDPDKIYMIITHEDRMIKHLRIDPEHDDRLWCISPNYKEFPIQKDDIKAVYQVVFVGRLV